MNEHDDSVLRYSTRNKRARITALLTGFSIYGVLLTGMILFCREYHTNATEPPPFVLAVGLLLSIAILVAPLKISRWVYRRMNCCANCLAPIDNPYAQKGRCRNCNALLLNKPDYSLLPGDGVESADWQIELRRSYNSQADDAPVFFAFALVWLVAGGVVINSIPRQSPYQLLQLPLVVSALVTIGGLHQLFCRKCPSCGDSPSRIRGGLRDGKCPHCNIRLSNSLTV